MRYRRADRHSHTRSSCYVTAAFTTNKIFEDIFILRSTHSHANSTILQYLKRKDAFATTHSRCSPCSFMHCCSRTARPVYQILSTSNRHSVYQRKYFRPGFLLPTTTSGATPASVTTVSCTTHASNLETTPGYLLWV